MTRFHAALLCGGLLVLAAGALLCGGCAGTPREAPPDPKVDCAEFLDTVEPRDIGRWRPLKRVAPRYPHTERTMRISGCVVMRFELDADGRVIAARALHATRESFANACLEVAERWVFEPPRVAEPRHTIVTIGFDPSGFLD